VFVVGDCGVLAWGTVCDSSLAVGGLLDGALCLGVSDVGVVSYVRVGIDERVRVYLAVVPDYDRSS